jgi:hypothetical protein
MFELYGGSSDTWKFDYTLTITLDDGTMPIDGISRLWTTKL